MTSGPERPWWVKPGGAPPPPPAGRPPSRRQPPPPARPDPHRGAYRPRPTEPRRPLPPQTPAPPGDRTPPRRSTSRQRLYVIGAVVGVVALVAVGLSVWKLQSSSGPRLDIHRAEAGVAEILTDPIHGYGANEVAAVACNNGKNPAIRVGATFTCAVDINGTVRHVAVEITDESGVYAVDGPR
ncbi:DUF4333 domain-containing protein [Mycobacterium sp. NPDC003449]